MTDGHILGPVSPLAGDLVNFTEEKNHLCSVGFHVMENSGFEESEVQRDTIDK